MRLRREGIMAALEKSPRISVLPSVGDSLRVAPTSRDAPAPPTQPPDAAPEPRILRDSDQSVRDEQHSPPTAPSPEQRMESTPCKSAANHYPRERGRHLAERSPHFSEDYMQLEFAPFAGTTLLTAPLRIADHDGQRVDQLYAALTQFAAATSPDVAAAAMDHCLTLVQPLVERVARIYGASWPTPAVDVDDLVQEGMLELAAAMADAPITTGNTLLAFVSATIFAALHPLWKAAQADASHERLLRRQRMVDVDDTEMSDPSDAWTGDEEAMVEADQTPSPLTLVGDVAVERLDRVLEALQPEESRVLCMRRDGYSWATVARLTGTSRRTVQRRYDAALSAARDVAMSLRDAA